MKGIRHCHAYGVLSVVLESYPDGRPKRRMFATERNHQLYRNDPAIAGERLSVAVHGHRANLSLCHVEGPVFQVRANVSSFGQLMGAWRFDSKILGGTGGFRREGWERVEFAQPYPLRDDFMYGFDLHTVFVPKGEEAAWIVEEHDISDHHTGIVYSNDDLSLFDPSGLYVPMTDDMVRAVCERFLGSDAA